MANVEIISCNRFGLATATHPNAKVEGSIREELNGPGSFSFSVPANDPSWAMLKPIAREVQVWVDGDLEFWGPIVSRETTDLTTTTIECQNPLYYFPRLYFGKAQRTNWLVNGSFDSGVLSPWSPVGVTANIVTNWGALPGTTYQLNLDQQGSGQDTFVTQSVSLPGGVFWTLTGYFHLRLDTTWVGPALDGRGLYVERLSTDNVTVEEVLFWAITDYTVRDGRFELATVGFHSPPGPNRTYRVRLYATRHTNPTPDVPNPPGGIVWDEIKLTAMESISFPRNDLADVLNGIVAHAQDATYNKANLNITPGATTTGNIVERHYQFADHNNIGDAISEFTEMGLCDIGIEYTSPTTRVLRSYAPRKGTVRTDVSLELDAQGSIIAVPSIMDSGDKTVTSVVMLGDGEGPGRDEAAAVNTSDTDGVVLEEIVSPNTRTHHDLLPLKATEYIASKYRIARTIEITASSLLVGRISLGDVIHTTIRPRGSALSIDVPYRIVATEHQPETNEFRLVLDYSP